MITKELINPRSIVVVGGSNDIYKPGGKVLKNLIDGNFKGDLFVTNPKENLVQGIKCFKSPADLPFVDLAIIAIAAHFIPATVELLTQLKNTKAFIILSAGFSEMNNSEGKIWEHEIIDSINNVNGSLVGPNCVGVLNPNYHGIFTLPIPKLDPKGCCLISGSGATACFILEAGIPKGLTFSGVYSVGNSAQLGVEEFIQHMDESYDPEISTDSYLLYIESIDKPEMLLKHASSLIRKGCRIAAIKSGSSEAGSRAASSHTGALASPDVAVESLFQKAGILRCNSREELITAGAIFAHKKLTGKNIAIITHAGGPAVMHTDALSKNGLNVPHIEGEKADKLLEELYPGSTVGNPIDFLATGTANQLGTIINYVDNKFDDIDGMVVIFGTPGLIRIFDVYEVLDKKMKTAKKPIFPVLPSTLTAKEEVDEFLSKGRLNFPDEVMLGNILARSYYTPAPDKENIQLPDIEKAKIRDIIDNASNGYISPIEIQGLLDAAGIGRTKEIVVKTKNDALNFAKQEGFPVVMKVVGPVHKSDVGGVVLNVKNEETVSKEFDRLMSIKDTYAVLIYPMLFGTEVFIGAKREDKFGHLVLCGLGGIFVEILKDVTTSLAPITKEYAHKMIKNLKGYKIIQGARNQDSVNEELFAEAIIRVAALVTIAPEIFEMDINPLIGTKDSLNAVDARIRIEK